MLRKISALFTALSFMFSSAVTVRCETYAKITEASVNAKVIQIIDGDSIKVQLSSGDIALVKLMGISTEGYNASVEYLTTRILGGTVVLSRDYNLTSLYKGNWNYMYVFYNGVNICSELVSKGLAVVDDSVAEAALYRTLNSVQLEASAKGSEIWSYGTRSSNTTGSTSLSSLRTGSYGEDMVNINTATAQQLAERLNSVTSGMASKIVEYRKQNPFNTIEEIKFVRGITSEVYILNKDIMTVTTNIREANRTELETLGNITESEIDDIIAYRRKSNFTDIKDLRRYDLINSTKYNNIEDYITISKGITSIDVHSSNFITNVNSATQSTLISAGFTQNDAKLITDNVTNGYTMKNIMEILAIDGISVDEEDLHKRQDKIHTVTNVNTANDTEMRSVFSTSDINKIKEARHIRNASAFITAVGNSVYEDTKGMITFNDSYSTYVNLNTATLEQLVSAGISSNNARLIMNARPIKTSLELPVNVADVNDKVTLYTNINTASRDELSSLGFSDSVVDAIVQYVSIQPFGTKDEIKKFMTTQNMGNLYSKIGDFIVVR